MLNFALKDILSDVINGQFIDVMVLHSQFFSAKKKRCNASKASTITSPSPIKRGTFDNCVVTDNSLDEGQKLLELQIKDHTPYKKENHETFTSLQGVQNLVHIDTSSQDKREMLETCKKKCSETKIEPSIDGQLDKVCASVAFDVNAGNPNESCVVLGYDSESKESEGNAFQNDKHKIELSQFANDFLSMCCRYLSLFYQNSYKICMDVTFGLIGQFSLLKLLR